MWCYRRNDTMLGKTATQHSLINVTLSLLLVLPVALVSPPPPPETSEDRSSLHIRLYPHNSTHHLVHFNISHHHRLGQVHDDFHVPHDLLQQMQPELDLVMENTTHGDFATMDWFREAATTPADGSASKSPQATPAATSGPKLKPSVPLPAATVANSAKQQKPSATSTISNTSPTASAEVDVNMTSQPSVDVTLKSHQPTPPGNKTWENPQRGEPGIKQTDISVHQDSQDSNLNEQDSQDSNLNEQDSQDSNLNENEEHDNDRSDEKSSDDKGAEYKSNGVGTRSPSVDTTTVAGVNATLFTNTTSLMVEDREAEMAAAAKQQRLKVTTFTVIICGVLGGTFIVVAGIWIHRFRNRYKNRQLLEDDDEEFTVFNTVDRRYDMAKQHKYLPLE